MSDLLMSLVNVGIVLCAVIGVAFIALHDRPYFVAIVCLCVGVSVHAFYILAPIYSADCVVGAHVLVDYFKQLDVCMETTLEHSRAGAWLSLWAAQVMILAGVAAAPVIYAGNMARRAERWGRRE